MLNCPHTCNPDVAKPLDLNKGFQYGVQKNEISQAGGRSEMQQLADSFHMGERLPKVVIGHKEVAGNLPTIIICEKIQRTCLCIEPNLEILPPYLRDNVEKEEKLKKQRILNCLLHKIAQLSDQIKNAQELNAKLNEQIVELIEQQNSCPFTCDKPVRMICPPKPTCLASSPCPPVAVCPALSKPKPCPALVQPSPCPPVSVCPACSTLAKQSTCPPMPTCPALAIPTPRTQNTDKCTGPCNEVNTDDITKLIGRLEKIEQSCENALKSKIFNENVNKMLHSCEGPCNLLKQQLECQGPCHTSIASDCFGPCSSTPNKLKDCDGPCNIKGMKNKIASLANVPAMCDKMKELLTDCYFNKEDLPRRYTTFNFKENPIVCSAQVPKCPGLETTPTCPSNNYTYTGVCKKNAVSKEIDEIEARVNKLNMELEKAREEHKKSLEEQKRFYECLKRKPCMLPSCPPSLQKPPCSKELQICPAPQYQ